MKKGKKVILFFVFIFSISMLYMLYYFYDAYKEKKLYANLLDTIKIEQQEIGETKTERMLQVEQLKKENSDIVAWLEIEGTNINYPVLQGSDNEYYLTRNYKKEKTNSGSLFLDKDYDFTIPSSNLLIYGHRTKKKIMFEDLIKYKEESFYQHHPNIRFTTIEEDSIYEIIAVFYGRVYYQDEKDVFRYYYFINAKNEEEYNKFVSNAKKESIYDTGKTAKYGEQLLTLSTCEYSQKDGRFAVVAKKRNYD